MKVTCFCPKCNGNMQIIMRVNKPEKGKHIACTKCEFRARYGKGGYAKYKHQVGK